MLFSTPTDSNFDTKAEVDANTLCKLDRSSVKPSEFGYSTALLPIDPYLLQLMCSVGFAYHIMVRDPEVRQADAGGFSDLTFGAPICIRL